MFFILKVLHLNSSNKAAYLNYTYTGYKKYQKQNLEK